MLATSLHNPAVSFKPGLTEFISMNKGIDDGDDISEDIIISVFTRYARVRACVRMAVCMLLRASETEMRTVFHYISVH